MKLVVPQKHVGPRSFFICLLVIELMQIIALDMYTPALPQMQEAFGVSAAYLNQTVFSFLLLSAFTMLVSGTISDRMGRRPVLLFGSSIFALSSLGCACTSSINVLIILRCGQAIGYGISATIGPAMLKDAYDNESLKVSMSLMQSLVIIGPIAAPFLGSLMLSLVNWRGIFWFLAGAGLVALACSLLLTETLPADTRQETASLAGLLRGMADDARSLLHTRGFPSLTAFLSLGGVPFFAFIAVSSYILLDEFGLSYLHFSIIYAVISIVNLAAPYVYLAISRHLDIAGIAKLSCAMVGVSAVLMPLIGGAGALGLVAAFAPYALAEGIIRPAAIVDLLDQPPTIVGTASALSNFSYYVFSSTASVIATLPWPTFSFGLAAVMIATLVALIALAVRHASTWASRIYR